MEYTRPYTPWRLYSTNSASTATVSCFLSWSSQDNFIKCSRISDGEKLYDFCLEQDNVSNQTKTTARHDNEQKKQNLQNLALLPVFTNTAAAGNDSEVHFWTQTENRVRVYRLSHVVVRLSKTTSGVCSCWHTTCRALPPAPGGRKTARSIVFMDDGSLCILSSITGQVLTICHSITLADRKVIDLQ